MKLKNILISSVLTLSLLTSTAFATGAENFADIQGHWAYDNIETAVDLGLFKGTSDTTFEPDQAMTCAEFVTVVMRTVAPEYSLASGEYWWTGSYELAMDLGIITTKYWDAEDMEADVTREVMGYLLGNAMKYTGEELNVNISSTRIPDYRHINNFYATNVLMAYSNGLLTGTDLTGTFSPDDTLTRAEAVTVLLRLKDPSLRVEVLSDIEYDPVAFSSITIYEGQTRTGRLARAGDIYVKADGTTITLAIDPTTGVLGYGQNVAPDEGLIVSTNLGTAAIAHDTCVNELDMTDSLGNKLQSEEYWINSFTGQGLWGQEWKAVTTKPTVTGNEFAYQLSEDMNWFYFDVTDSWSPIYSNNQTDIFINLIKEANDL